MTDQQSVAANLQLTRVGIVVGEASGDTLGAGLMRSLKEQFPGCEFEGVGGPKMIAEGFSSLYKLDRLAVMGLIDPLKRLPELLRMPVATVGTACWAHVCRACAALVPAGANPA